MRLNKKGNTWEIDLIKNVSKKPGTILKKKAEQKKKKKIKTVK